MDTAMIEIEETKQQNFATLQRQAQEFIDQELLRRDAERAAHMEQEIERRLAEALQNKMLLSPAKSGLNVEMAQSTPDRYDSRLKEPTNVQRMGTRKHPVAFGKSIQENLTNVIKNMSEMSRDNDSSYGRP